MVNTKLLLCFVLAVSAVKIIECKGGRGGGRGGHGSHSHGSHSSRGGGWFSGWGRSSSGSSSHSYPASNGYSGHGSGGSHSYPSSNGYSGHGSGGSHSYPSSHGYSGSGSGSRYWGPQRSVPTYYTSPQHVYVTQYRNSDSRYSDLLTGLTMYNLGRSHGYYHHHYYSDDYYRSSTRNRDTNTAEVSPNEEATCFLRIKRNNQEDVLKIPCAIVSTFDSGATEIEDLVGNKTLNNCTSVLNATLDNKLANATLDDKIMNATFDSQPTHASLDKLTVNETSLNVTTNANEPESNMTVICNGTVAVEDPLAVKGAPVDVKDMECSVEIRARIGGEEKMKVTRNNVDCKALLQQAKMAVPENKNSDILPSRQKLKAMLDKPPWWLALFFAV